MLLQHSQREVDMISDKWTLGLDIAPISVVIICFHIIPKPLSLSLRIQVNHMVQKRREGDAVVLL